MLPALAGLLECSTASAQRDQADATPPQKNVVILLADDLGWGDVGFHGGVAETPNIDRLASEGLELDRFYAYPACSPARAAMLTGRFPHRYGITGPVRPRDEGLPMSERLLVADFQDAGYQTALVGKWHLSRSTDVAHNPARRGFDHFYGFLDASIDYYKHTNGRGQIDWQRNGQAVEEEGYATDLLTREAIRIIETRRSGSRQDFRPSNRTGNRQDARQGTESTETLDEFRYGGKPLCMVVAYNAPHSPFQAPEHLIAKYRGRLDERSATYAAMIESMDQGIGKIMTAIERQGMRDDTIIVFASDNGAARMGTNAPLRGQKRQVYDGAIRVPCIIHAPGIVKPGTVSDQMIAIHDLLPTLAGAVGVQLGTGSGSRQDFRRSDKTGTLDEFRDKPLDGENLWPNLVSGRSKPRQIVIAEEDFAIFQDSWKLIQSAAGVELYDIVADPSEQQNLAQRHSKIVADLLGELTEFKQQVAADQPATPVVAEVVKSFDTPSKLSTSSATERSVVEGSSLAGVQLQGDADFGILGNRLTESNGKGIRLMSAVDLNGDKQLAGEASIVSNDIKPADRWYRFDILGMAQDGFAVDKDNLYLKVEFFQKGRNGSLDFIKTRVYPQVVQERKDFKDEGTNASLGLGTWRTYAMDFRTPFAEIDSVKLSVGFTDGTGKGKQSEFWVNSVNLQPIPVPAEYEAPANAERQFPQPDPNSLVALGGRWYFDSQGGAKRLPKQFDYTNADQLLYKSDRFEAPFAGNMSSWLRAGYKDFEGNIVEKDEPKPYAVVISVTKDHIVMRSRNLPNHPTATFPDKWRMLDGNPSYIQEKANTWYLPKEPKMASDPIAMDDKNANGALPMGPIGVATNGVIFFNPFDHIFETDAVWRLDRCCGHPSPQSAYHYHKYPVCVKTPWSDEGKMHSSVIGFAFDGLPVYGPYEADGLLAKDNRQNPLNDFNLHEDAIRGPHYHVTPGKFPHIIGGYWGELDPMNGRGRRAR
ncbi:Arylsulfatase [Rosistilla ulvae]|uniref:Arylsulfatase n=2 Tax=Rosistilla ulvae TaxID=1930277 RepID=A0A517M2E2_9BACT|nr:Arylsulfatase [Rosistilla ulvae]